MEKHNEIEEFIKKTFEGISAGANDNFELMSNVEFELSVLVTKSGKGGIDLAIVGGGGQYSKESVSKIRFTMGNEMGLYHEKELRRAGRPAK